MVQHLAFFQSVAKSAHSTVSHQNPQSTGTEVNSYTASAPPTPWRRKRKKSLLFQLVESGFYFIIQVSLQNLKTSWSYLAWVRIVSLCSSWRIYNCNRNVRYLHPLTRASTARSFHVLRLLYRSLFVAVSAQKSRLTGLPIELSRDCCCACFTVALKNMFWRAMAHVFTLVIISLPQTLKSGASRPQRGRRTSKFRSTFFPSAFYAAANVFYFRVAPSSIMETNIAWWI